MRTLIVYLLAGGLLNGLPCLEAAPPGAERGGKAGNGSFAGQKGGIRPSGPRGVQSGINRGKVAPNDGENGQCMIQQFMSLDANGDDALTPDEVADPRVQAMLSQADSDGNGVVTRVELITMNSLGGQNASGTPAGPPRPCEIMPGIMQQQLQLTDNQRHQIAALQAQVDLQIAQILTTRQLQQLTTSPMGSSPGGNGRFPRK